MPADTDRHAAGNDVIHRGETIEDSESDAEPSLVQALQADPRLLHSSDSNQETARPPLHVLENLVSRPQDMAQVPEQSTNVHQYDQGGQPGLDSTASLWQAEAKAAHLQALIARHEQSLSPAADIHVICPSGLRDFMACCQSTQIPLIHSSLLWMHKLQASLQEAMHHP